jgi:hypothetical protein
MANGDFVIGLAWYRLNRVEMMKNRAITAQRNFIVSA